MHKLMLLTLVSLWLATACGKAPSEAPVAATSQPAASAGVNLPAAHSPTDAVELSATGAHFAAKWHFAPAKVGELFAADLTLTDSAGKPVTSPTLSVDVTMPAHGHGMMTDPELKQIAPTRWHVDGLKLHMHGAWQFEVRVESVGVKERLTAMYEQPPIVGRGLVPRRVDP